MPVRKTRQNIHFFNKKMLYCVSHTILNSSWFSTQKIMTKEATVLSSLHFQTPFSKANVLTNLSKKKKKEYVKTNYYKGHRIPHLKN